jgi:hypothetical protein
MIPAVPANAGRIASASYMSTTKTTRAEVARYGYWMMKRGKQAAGSRFTDHDSRLCVALSACRAVARAKVDALRFPHPDHTALCFAEIDALFEHSRLERGAATRRKRFTGMK